MGFLRRRKKQAGGSAPQPEAVSVLDLFLKIDGIEGESVDKGHPKEIRVHDFEIAAENPGVSPSGKGGGKVDLKDAVFLIDLDRSIIGALGAGSKGTHIKSAVFTARKSGGGQQDYLKWTFGDLIIAMVRIEDTGSGAPVMAAIALNYTTVKVEYKEQKPDGSLGAPVSAGFDAGKGSVL